MIVNELKYPWLAAAAIAGGSPDGNHHHHHHPQQQLQLQQVHNHQHHTQGFPSIVPPVSSSPRSSWSSEGLEAISSARAELKNHGAVAFPNFLTQDALESAVEEMLSKEEEAFTTITDHTPYLTQPDLRNYDPSSIYNHCTKTIVASTAYDELSEDSVLKQLYTDPRLLKLVTSIVSQDEMKPKKLYLSEDPLGCCSVNVFRPGYYHGFHYDESEFSVTLMLQDAQDPSSGLFQHTDPIRTERTSDGTLSLETKRTADIFRDHEHDENGGSQSEDRKSNVVCFAEHGRQPIQTEKTTSAAAAAAATTTTTTTRQHKHVLHTLDFRPGTLLVLAGSKSLHRVTEVRGDRSRFVAVLTFATKQGFCNTPEVQEMFWGRTASSNNNSASSTLLHP